jgi:hypothetical protein
VGNNNSPTVTPQFFYLSFEIKRIKQGNYGNRCFEILEFQTFTLLEPLVIK